MSAAPPLGASTSQAGGTAAPAPLTMLEFNWLPALYAHAHWWGSALALRATAQRADQRIVHSVSARILRCTGLQHAPCAALAGDHFALLPAAPAQSLAYRLGRLLLARRVRQALSRERVLQSLALLGQRGRDEALDDAERWPQLAALGPDAEPLPVSPPAVAELGAQFLCALLPAHEPSLRQRFLLRFAPDTVQPRLLPAPAHAVLRAQLPQLTASVVTA